MDFQFYMPAKIVSGENAVEKSASLMDGFGKSCLIVTGARSAAACGALGDITAALDKLSIRWCIFSRIGENPTVSSCLDAAAEAIEFGADFILGIGGGSPLDAAKAIALLAANPDLDGGSLYALCWKNKPLPIVLTGTTSGTGSEVSPTAVLTNELGRKRGLSHPDLYADLVFADPKYTYSLPRSVTVSTGLDALSHALEGFLSPQCGSMDSVFAKQAIPVLWRHLKDLHAGTTLTEAMHGELYYASLWAGLVLNSLGTAYPHPFGYVLTEDFGIPHGRACAVFLPSLVARAMERAKGRAEEFLQMIGCDFAEFQSVISALSGCGNVAMTAEQISGYAARFHGLKHYKNVPGGYTPEEAEELFRSLFLKP